MLKVDINLLFTAINLLVLYILMKLFLFKPVHKILEERQGIVDKNLADADAAKASALALEQQHSQALEGIDQERKTVLDQARKEASQEYERIVADANHQAQNVIEDAKIEAEKQKANILRKAQNEITDMVVAATARVVGSAVQDDSGLYDKFLEKAGESVDQASH